ncbi:MAG: transcriptional regulator GcvA [Pseudomonadota bacterium]
MRRALPPLNALRAFEAAARHLSFTKAAAELNVTPAAISHQVKSFEAFLGVPLFRRLTRALRLTDAGQAALPLLQDGFDALAAGVDRLRSFRDADELTISVSPSFGAMWLVPRLDRFRRRYPEIEIRIDGTDRRVDIRSGEADLAIRYGAGGYTSVRVDRLFGQVNTPVCSPSLLKGPTPLRQPADLSHHTLLHIDWKDAEASWRMWLLAAGLPEIDAMRGPRFSAEDMAVRAAVDRQGVALVGHRLVADHLAAGRLVRPFDDSFSTPLSFAYYLLSPKDGASASIAAFRTWLLEETEAATVSNDAPHGLQQPGNL